MSYWEDYHHKQGFKRCLLLVHEKTRRSPPVHASFGIRASALDSQKDLEKRRRERHDGYAKFADETCKILEEILLEENQKKIEREKEEKERKEKKEKMLRGKETEKEVEGEKNSHESMSSNVVPSSFDDLISHDSKEESPKEASSYESPSSKRKCVDIIPSAPLLIQPTFGSPTHMSNEEKAEECAVENTIANQKLFVNDLFLCEKKIFHGLFAINFYSLKQIWSLSLFKEYICFRIEKKASSMVMKMIKLDFQRLVFDPGGHIIRIDLRTNSLEEGGNDVNPKGSILFFNLVLLIFNKSLLWWDVCTMKKTKIEELHQDQGRTKRGAALEHVFSGLFSILMFVIKVHNLCFSGCPITLDWHHLWPH